MKKYIYIGLLIGSTINSFAGHWQCYARNSYGIDFWGIGPDKRSASENALFACETNTDLAARCWITDWCDWRY